MHASSAGKRAVEPGGFFGNSLPFDGRCNLSNAHKAFEAEFVDLVAFLAAHPRQVFTRGQLLEKVWNSSSEWLGEATVTEHVHRLRLKLEQDPSRPRVLRTVRGIGYQLVDDG